MTSELESRIKELEKGRRDTDAENIKRVKAEVAKLRRDIDELNAFFQKYRMALEVQGGQHRLHNTSWYKDVKKLEDIVDRDRKKRTLCQLNGIYLLEVWYDENPEITIPQKIYKFKECIDRKDFNLD